MYIYGTPYANELHMLFIVLSLSIACIPKKTITSITALICKFLWSKIGQERYMSLIAWHKVCLNKEGRRGTWDSRSHPFQQGTTLENCVVDCIQPR